MSSFTLLLLLATAAAVVSADHDQLEIVGGDDVALGEFFYQVQLRILSAKSQEFLCGGVIIQEDLVLTAAHCVNHPGVFVYVYAGLVNRYLPTPTKQTRYAADFVVHENYFDIVDGNDIAILKVDRPFEFNDYVGAVKLPTPGQKMVGSCVATGWGAQTNRGRFTSSHLMKVYIPVITDTECEQLYDREFPESMLCAGLVDIGGVGTCKGDSGGPFVCKGVLGGITSGGGVCAGPRTPAVFTEVSYFIDWINAKADYLTSK